jgi:hypothetical protein
MSSPNSFFATSTFLFRYFPHPPIFIISLAPVAAPLPPYLHQIYLCLPTRGALCSSRSLAILPLSACRVYSLNHSSCCLCLSLSLSLHLHLHPSISISTFHPFARLQQFLYCSFPSIFHLPFYPFTIVDSDRVSGSIVLSLPRTLLPPSGSLSFPFLSSVILTSPQGTPLDTSRPTAGRDPQPFLLSLPRCLCSSTSRVSPPLHLAPPLTPSSSSNPNEPPARKHTTILR